MAYKTGLKTYRNNVLISDDQIQKVDQDAHGMIALYNNEWYRVISRMGSRKRGNPQTAALVKPNERQGMPEIKTN